MATTIKTTTMDKTILDIAAKHLGIETLEARNMDSLDFSEQGVWELKAALEAAYKAGLASYPR